MTTTLKGLKTSVRGQSEKLLVFNEEGRTPFKKAGAPEKFTKENKMEGPKGGGERGESGVCGEHQPKNLGRLWKSLEQMRRKKKCSRKNSGQKKR